MEVTEIRIKLAANPENKLRAFCTVTFDDCFVVRDLKIISGARGPFVAMPSRKLADVCPHCRGKNHLRALHCNECGAKLSPDRAEHDEQGRAKLHADIAHPIHSEYRDYLQGLVLEAFERELKEAGQPGYQPPHDDLDISEKADAPPPPPDGPEPPPADPPPHKSDNKFGEGILP